MNEVTDWVHWLMHVRRVRGATTDAYWRTLLAFQDWLGHKQWATVRGAQIEEFMGRPRRGGVIGSPATQDRDRAALGSFFKFLETKGKIERNPIFDVGVPKINNRQPRAVDDFVWSRLWRADLPDEDRVWLGLGCFAGLRRQEIVSLSPQQVDPHRGLLTRLERKGGNEDAVEFAEMARIVSAGLPQVLPDAEAWIALVATQARSRGSERVLITMDTPASAGVLQRSSFTDPLLPDPSVVNKRLKQVLRLAGLPANAFTPHAMRHTCVTNLLRCGVPIEVVSDVIGHSNIDTTRRYVKSAGRLADWTSRLAQDPTKPRHGFGTFAYHGEGDKGGGALDPLPWLGATERIHEATTR